MGSLELVIETGKSLNKHVCTLISILVAASNEEIKGIVEIKVVVAVKVAANKLVNLFLFNGVEVLKLVDGRKLDHVEAIGEDTIGA